MRPVHWFAPALFATLAACAPEPAAPVAVKPPEFPAKLPTFGEPDVAGWTRVNEGYRHRMDRATGSLCAVMPAETPLEEMKRRGAHNGAFTETFVNDAGKAAMFSSDSPIRFPVGSTIIKVKYYSAKDGTALLRTVMIKREKGYNPACGDWEFVATDGAGKPLGQPGNPRSCMSCHTRQSIRNDDFTFRREYLPTKLLAEIKGKE